MPGTRYSPLPVRRKALNPASVLMLPEEVSKEQIQHFAFRAVDVLSPCWYLFPPAEQQERRQIIRYSAQRTHVPYVSQYQ